MRSAEPDPIPEANLPLAAPVIPRLRYAPVRGPVVIPAASGLTRQGSDVLLFPLTLESTMARLTNLLARRASRLVRKARGQRPATARRPRPLNLEPLESRTVLSPAV